jgi:hypothetical protein
MAGGTVAVVVASAGTGPARTTGALLGAGGVVVLAVVLLLGLPQFVALAAALVGGGYAASLAIASAGTDLAAPAVAAALLLACELAFWAHELRTTSPDERGLRGLRVAWLSALTLASLVVGGALVTLVDLARVDGLPIEAVGTAAALGIAVLLLLSSRQRA